VTEGAGFDVVASWKQIAIIAAGLAVLAGLGWLLTRTRFGLFYRACADDKFSAALMGANVDRVVAQAFTLGGALAGFAGFVLIEYYGVANFFMGFLIGFKALTAAIVGGIGSIRGAVLGGALIALLETFWSGYLGGTYREVAVFSVLALVLAFRPSGLLGRAPDVLYQDAR
jgi:branched-chain amino acid transport system permease protein